MRSTNLGYGNKSDFTKGDIQKPGPDRYNTVSIFDSSNPNIKGSTFSLGREVTYPQLLKKEQWIIWLNIFIITQLCVFLVNKTLFLN